MEKTPSNSQMGLEEAQNEANMVKVLTKELQEVCQVKPHKPTKEDYDNAFGRLENIVKGLKESESGLSMFVHKAGELLPLFSVFPNLIDEIEHALVDVPLTTRLSAGAVGKRYVSFNEALKEIIPNVIEKFKKENKDWKTNWYKDELERIQRKADELNTDK
jgi:hypothetical protein